MATSWLDMSGWAMVVITLAGAYVAGRQRRRKEHEDTIVANAKSDNEWRMGRVANEMIRDLRVTEAQLRELLVADRKMIDTLEQALTRGRDLASDLRDIIRRLVRILQNNNLSVPQDALDALED